MSSETKITFFHRKFINGVLTPLVTFSDETSDESDVSSDVSVTKQFPKISRSNAI